MNFDVILPESDAPVPVTVNPTLSSYCAFGVKSYPRHFDPFGGVIAPAAPKVVLEVL